MKIINRKGNDKRLYEAYSKRYNIKKSEVVIKKDDKITREMNRVST